MLLVNAWLNIELTLAIRGVPGCANTTPVSGKERRNLQSDLWCSKISERMIGSVGHVFNNNNNNNSTGLAFESYEEEVCGYFEHHELWFVQLSSGEVSKFKFYYHCHRKGTAFSIIQRVYFAGSSRDSPSVRLQPRGAAYNVGDL
jgi:hypothetical protein